MDGKRGQRLDALYVAQAPFVVVYVATANGT